MSVFAAIQTDWHQLVEELGPQFRERASTYDQQGEFVHENYALLKEHRFFSAMIPEELGGGGISFTVMCQLIRKLAHYCGSTALAFSMHQHLVAAAVWKYRHKGLSEATLRKVADQQLVLVCTGARDWLGSNGSMKKVEGGYLVSARKSFASQSIVGSVAVTSAPYQNELGEWKVLHFPVPFNAEGVSVENDWDVLGMRATGSCTVVFENVFVPETAVGLERSRDSFHPAWDLVLSVAMPIIMSAYVGVAEQAVKETIRIGKSYQRLENHLPYILGKLNNQLVAAQSQWRTMVHIPQDLNFAPQRPQTVEVLSLKTNVADACLAVLAQSCEAAGGQSFYKKNALERLFRDIQAAPHHPLPKWDQYAFCGNYLVEEA